MDLKERFLKYVQIHTASSEETDTVPSSACQFDLGRELVAEMKELGIADARMDDKAYVYGTIPATAGYEDRPSVGFIAHLDTIPDFPGDNVHPIIHENYDGSDVELGAGRSITHEMFDHLDSLKGKTLITTDGTTVLGADDKAGVAEIMTLADNLIHGSQPHGRIAIGFTPDEEIGGGAEYLDIPAFGADFAYTVDGGPVYEVSYENFNAAAAVVEINGVNIHPGSAKNKMKNASLIAMEFNALLPAAERPEHTEDREGFFHMMAMDGNVEKAKLAYIIRDHDIEHFRCRKETMQHAAAILNERYGQDTVIVNIRDQYQNMLEIMKQHMDVIEYAEKAVRSLGLTPQSSPVRGGTDGASLTLRGLPCPNLGTGGYACHGPYEHVCVEDMEEVVRLLEDIVKNIAEG